MRISAVARAAGVSARTVRFYHELGVLPEPRRLANGYRDYSFADLARLLRLRWLADSGLPLAVAGPSLKQEHDLLDDVDTALACLEGRLHELAGQRLLLQGLRDNLVAGRRLSPLPVHLTELFEQLLDDADPAAREVLLTERETLEALALVGGAQPVLLDLYADVLATPDAREVLLPLMSRFADLRGADPDRHREQVDRLAEDISVQPRLARLLQHAVSGLPPGAFTREDGAGSDAGPGAHDIVPDPAQRAVLAEVVRRVGS